MNESNNQDLVYGSSFLGGLSALLLFLGFQLYYTKNVTVFLSIQYIYMQILLTTILLVIWLFVGYGLIFGNDYYYLFGISSFGFINISVNNYSQLFYQYCLILLSTSLLIKFIELKYPFYYYIVIASAHALLCHCVLAHWIWSSDGWASPYRSEISSNLLNSCGVIDTSGVSFIFLSTGLSALIVYAISPYDIDLIKKSDKITDNPMEVYINNEILQQRYLYRYIGFVLCIIGFIGINAVANLPIYLSINIIGQRVLNVILAIGSSIVTGSIYLHFVETDLPSHLALYHIMEHALSACVAVSASSSVIAVEGSVIIGFISCVLNILTWKYQKIYSYDLYLPISIQFVNGIWGLLSSGILASRSNYSNNYADSYFDGSSRVDNCKGLMYNGKGYQLVANVIGISSVITLIVFIIGLMYLFGDKVVNKYINKLIEESRYSIEQTNLNKEKIRKYENEIENYINKINNKKDIKKEIKDVTNENRIESNNKIDLEINDNDIKTENQVKFNINNTKEDFFERNGYNYDVCIVFPVKSDKQIALEKHDPNHDTSNDFAQIVKKLRSCGFETYQYFSIQNDEIYVKIRLDHKHFCFYADVLDYILPLDEEKVKNKASEGKEWIDELGRTKTIKPFSISSGPPGLTNYSPYQYLFSKYDQDPDVASLFSNGIYVSKYLSHPFSSIHRLKIILSIIEGSSEQCCNININTLLRDNHILAIYPLHDQKSIDELKTQWLDWYIPPWKQPNDLVKEYFGEHIGLYFYFLSYYTTSLLPLSILGILVTFHLIVNISIYGSFYGALSRVYSVPVFCLAISFYTQYLCVYWKRTEKKVSLRWGMSNFEDNESIRLEYEGISDVSYIDGSPTKYFSPKLKKKRVFRSKCLIALSIIFVILCFSAAFYANVYFKIQNPTSVLFIYGPTVVSIANALQVIVLGYLYNSVATALNDYENWRTDTEYEDHLISKLFVFNFVNSYSPSFYIAFVKNAIGDKCEANSCMGELSKSLLIILVSKLFIAKFTTYVTNRLVWIYTYHEETKNTGASALNMHQTKDAMKAELSAAEKEYILPYYDHLLGSIDDYNEISIQYGFITLFIAATPFAIFLAFIGNYIEIRADGYNLLKYSRRPFPYGAQDIGSWYTVFEIISIIAILTNAGIVFYTMDILDGIPNYTRLWLACVYLFLSFFCRFLIQLSVSDTPKAVDIQLKRNEFIVDKLINCIPDEELDELDNKTFNDGDIQIHMSDNSEKIL